MSSLAPSLVYLPSSSCHGPARPFRSAYLLDLQDLQSSARSHSALFACTFLFLPSIDISMQHLSPHPNELSAAQQSTLSPAARTLSSVGHDQRHGPNPSSKNAELQSSRAYLSSRAPLPHSHPITHHHLKSPSNHPRPSPKRPVLIVRPHISDFLRCAPPEVVSLPYQNPSTGSRLAAVTGRHLTHLQYVLPFSRTPHFYPQLAVR
jgi:hypothetical protein